MTLDSKLYLPTEPSVLDRHAAQIMTSATEIVRRVLGILDAPGQQDTLVAIGGGEEHESPAFDIRHILIVKGFRDAGAAVAVGFEKSHNKLEKSFLLESGPEAAALWPVAREALGVSSPLQAAKAALATGIGWSHRVKSSIAELVSHDYMLEKTVPATLTDVDRIGVCLNRDDPSTAKALSDCYPDGLPPGPVPTYEREGMNIRNRHAAVLGTEFAATAGARILYQACGVGHVEGLMDKFPGAESLCAHFKRLGARPFSVLALSEDLFVPEDTVITRKDRHALVFKGARLATGVLHTAETREQEKAYVAALLSRCGMPEEARVAQDFDARIAQRRREIELPILTHMLGRG